MLHHADLMPYRDSRARPVNGPTFGPMLYCKATGVGAAFVSRRARNYAKIDRLDSL